MEVLQNQFKTKGIMFLVYKNISVDTGFLIMIKYIYNQMFYLQEYGILLGGCLTEKN